MCLYIPLVLKNVLMYTTGSLVPRKNSIRVDFLDGDSLGAISCHRLICFPRNVFSEDTKECLEMFSWALMAIIEKNNHFNIV